MKRFNVLMLIGFVLTVLSGNLHAHTILIDTWESAAPAQMEVEDRVRVISAETGIMDSLFESGHIFFNIYSVPDDDGSIPEFSTSLKIAMEIGADYVLKLNPDTEGVGWNLYNSVDSTELDSGYTPVSETDIELGSIERWTLVGSLVAKGMAPAL